MKKIFLVAAITSRECMRNRIVAGMSFMASLVFVLNFFLANSFNYEVGKVAVDIGLSMISFCSLLIIVFLCINQLSRDLDRRIVYLFLARPLSRYEYVLGKFFGFGLLLLVAVLLLGGGAALSVLSVNLLRPAYVPLHFNWFTFFLAIGFSYIASLILLSIAILFTILSSTSFLAVLYTLAIYIAGQHLERVIRVLRDVSVQVSGETGFNAVLTAVSWIIPNLSAFDLKLHAAHGLPIDSALLIWTSLYGLVYICLILTAAVLLFSDKELA